MKTCVKCKLEKDNSEFHYSKSKKDGLNSYCKICSRAKAIEFYRRNVKHVGKLAGSYRTRLRLLVDDIKIKYGCQYCGEKIACCLDFHHIDDNKDIDVSLLISKKNKKKIFDEINKCIVLCSNCHRKTHNGIIDCSNIKTCSENILDYFEERHGRFYTTDSEKAPEPIS